MYYLHTYAAAINFSFVVNLKTSHTLLQFLLPYFTVLPMHIHYLQLVEYSPDNYGRDKLLLINY